MFLKSSKKFIIENSMREKKFEKKVHPKRGNLWLPLSMGHIPLLNRNTRYQ